MAICEMKGTFIAAIEMMYYFRGSTTNSVDGSGDGTSRLWLVVFEHVGFHCLQSRACGFA